MAKQTVREAVGVFHDEAALHATVDELLIGGFDRAEISLLAGQKTVDRKLGHLYEKVTELEDDPDAPYLAYIGTDSRAEAKGAVIGGLGYVGAIAAVGMIVASGGTIAAALLGAAAVGGTGGLVGAALARFLDRHHAQYLQEHLERGGLLLWVRTKDELHEERATEILKRHAAEDVHLHDLPEPTHIRKEGMSHDLSFMRFFDSPKKPAG